MKKQHFRYLFYLLFRIPPPSHRITTRSKVTFSCYSSDFSSLKAPPIPARCREAGYDIINNVLGLCVCHSVAEYLSSVPLAKADSELLNRTFFFLYLPPPHNIINITTNKKYIKRNSGMQCYLNAHHSITTILKK